MSTLQTFIGNSFKGYGGTTFGYIEEFTTDFVQGFFYNTASVPNVMQNIADALTNAMRAISAQRIKGMVLAMEVYIKVQ